MSMKQNRGRFAVALAVLATAFLFAACGGGSGGGTTPLPPPPPVVPTGSFTASAPSCVIQQDLNSCPIQTTVKTENATAVTLKDSKGTAYAVGVNTTVSIPVNVPVGSETFTLSFGGATNPSVKLSATCIPGTVVDENGDCKGPLRYTDVHVAVRYGRPGIMTLAAPWTEAKNETSYQSGSLPVFNCFISEAPQSDGFFLELCQAASDGDFHIVRHNPITNTLSDFVGTVPAGHEVTRTGPSTWAFGKKWHAVRWGVAPYSYMSGWAVDAPGGYFYTDLADDRILRYQSASGAQSVLYTSSDGGAFTVMTTISN